MSVDRLLRIARQRLRTLFRRRNVDVELARELSFHLEHLTQEFVDTGMSPDEARRAAQRAIGNIPLLEEQCRDTRAITWLHDVRQDLVYAARVLRRNPGFTVVAVLSLALGIGANTAVLSVIDAVLRDALPIADDNRLVVLRTFPRDNPQQETHALVADYLSWRDETRSFELMGAAMGHNADFGPDSGGAAPERIGGQSVTPETLIALGVQPIRGRLFATSESQGADAGRSILISHRLWQRRFAGREDIVDHPVRLGHTTWTIVGVMPERFRYPSESVDYWVPMQLDQSQERNPQRFYVVTARLKPGVTIEQAQSDLEIVSARLERRDPDRHEGWGVRVKPMREAMLGWTRERLFTLEGAVVLVLLVACANLAGLLLARGLVRGPEMALRIALGAGHGRIVRQLLTESALLSFAGGILGLCVAWAGMRALTAMPPPPGGVAIDHVALSVRTFAITAVISIATGLLYGLAPVALHAMAPMADRLKESSAGGRSRRPRVRNTLVAVQIAITVILLVGAGLLTNSFVRVAARDLNFNSERLLTFEMNLPLDDFLRPQGTVAGLPYFEISPPPSITFQHVYRGLQGLTGTESVAGVSVGLINSLVVPSATISRDTAAGTPAVNVSPSLAIGIGAAMHVNNRRPLTAAYFLVTPSFFTSMQTPLVDGRDFSEHDAGSAQWVAIVNETAAHLFWPGENPIGRRFTILNSPDERPRDIVGIVRDIPLTLEGDVRPAVYTSYLQQPSHYPLPGANMFGHMVFMARSAGDPISLVPGARRVVDTVNPDLPLVNLGTMDQRLASVVPTRGYLVFAVSAFALAATLLAAIGIYGVMAYSVAQRSREIGIRMALGAAAHEVVAVVGQRTFVVVSLGLGAGLLGAFGAARLIRSQLWGVTAGDPLTFVAVSVLFLVVAFVAAFVPMRRAISINPTIALRCE